MKAECGDPSFCFKYRGPVQMKGKKEPMHCWLLSRDNQQASGGKLDILATI